MDSRISPGLPCFLFLALNDEKPSEDHITAAELGKNLQQQQMEIEDLEFAQTTTDVVVTDVSGALNQMENIEKKREDRLKILING